MRTIKFRYWSPIFKKMIMWDTEGGCDAEFWGTAYGNPTMQCTGLKDKNGKEIYEGDIVMYKVESMLNINNKITERFGAVEMSEYEDGEGCYDEKHLGWCVKADTDIKTLPDVAEWSEVIGNIYESPDLLTK